MSAPRDYESIPGTYVYDAERGRVALKTTCMVDGKVVIDGDAEVMVPRRQ